MTKTAVPRTAVRAAASRWHSDLALLLAATALCYLGSTAFQLSESIAPWLAHHEKWQLDELPLSGMVLAFGLAWYTWRRRQETVRELRRREQAEAHVAELLARNRELAQHVIAVQERESLALARELHDELGQRCSAILIETACLRRCAGEDRTSWLGAAARVDIAAQSLYRIVGAMLRRLRPATLDALGLVPALQDLCESWTERSALPCDFHCNIPEVVLPDLLEITLYRVAQEALTNVMRHAKARHVRVELLQLGAAEVRLTIEDDGRGMNTAEIKQGLGLLGATERAAAIGGRLNVEGRPGVGVRITLLAPFDDLAQVSMAEAA